jgi:hypothetical protein
MKKYILHTLKRSKDLLFIMSAIRNIRFFHYRFHHPYRKLGYKRGKVLPHKPHVLEEQLFNRLVHSIKNALDFTSMSQWKDISNEYQSEVVECLQNEDFATVKSMLSDPISNNLMYGFDNLSKQLQSRFRLESRTESAMTADHFLALSEFLGVIKYQSTEGLNSPKKFFIDMNPLIDSVFAEVFEEDISLPNFYPGETGISTAFGVASLRVPAAIYQAIQVVKLGKNICEIGPGLGRTAYFSNLLGARKYTLVDIPISSLCQGYFLLNSLPDVEFSMCSEDDIDKGIQLRLPDQFFKSSEEYDVIINVDSLTEIGIDAAREYLKEIVGRAKFFFSINHEGNEFSIRELAGEFSDLKLVSRSRSWVRTGYVEELYEIKK